ncbi:nitric oxide dioxygenase [Exophiala aquamarina CBS 119918]|uniref:Flavohemoprotein n=1 Tax=Exophiala aquamarina CBS 119918 TaxID=1182545 RepID=A0A072PP17_9EURO|nr:nitric oxide dioxygenase [Exophiala aquamarina CBS 119918]KEF61487.1 nitric oxide dioxygenase [Exophiala aquamarina CBS 119918]
MLARFTITRALATATNSARTTAQGSAVAAALAFNSKASFHSSPSKMGLTPEQEAIVKSTAPVLAQHGTAITTHFYKRMLSHHPELRNIFNAAHQGTGTQPAALAHAVWAYAENIDNLGALTTAVSRIGHKHASLGITPDQYPIVGENLLASLKEVLGDAITEPIVDAWGAAYQQLADIFINFERDLYQKAKQTPGGWNGWRKFRVAKKVPESDEIVSFYLEPLDQGKLPPFISGQYISVRVWVPELGVYQPRQYSLSDAPDEKHFRISVKKEAAQGADKPAGRISNVLHQDTPEGAEIDVSNPYGDFTLDVETNAPAVLISGGVGLTPMISMLGTLVESAKSRQVVFVHAVRNGKVHAMKKYLSLIMQENPQVSKAIFYEEVGGTDEKGLDYDHEGRIDLHSIKDQVLLPNAEYYLCGPIPFMQEQQKNLEALGVPKEKIHSEVFGSGII